MRDIKGGRGDPICRITVDAEHSCCVVLRCRSCRPEYACSPRPKTAMQAGCHLLVCETFCWSGLNSSPTKRMERQRSSSSLAGLGRDLALNGSFGRVRDECRSPEWRAEIVAVSVESVSRSKASRASRYVLQNTPRAQLGAASALSGQPQSRSSLSPQKVCRIAELASTISKSQTDLD